MPFDVFSHSECCVGIRNDTEPVLEGESRVGDRTFRIFGYRNRLQAWYAEKQPRPAGKRWEDLPRDSP